MMDLDNEPLPEDLPRANKALLGVGVGMLLWVLGTFAGLIASGNLPGWAVPLSLPAVVVPVGVIVAGRCGVCWSGATVAHQAGVEQAPPDPTLALALQAEVEQPIASPPDPAPAVRAQDAQRTSVVDCQVPQACGVGPGRSPATVTSSTTPLAGAAARAVNVMPA